VMSRYFAQRGMSMKDAAAGVTVSTTLQALAQMVFALMGVAMLGAHATNQAPEHAIRTALLVAGGVVMFCLTGFYLAQRNGLFGKLVRVLRRFAGKRDLAKLISQADAIDHAVQDAYGRRGRAAASFFLSLAGWVIGTVEVYVILLLLQFPVSWSDALMLESLGQAIRAAGFAIPGSLGIQEGGFLLLAPLVGMRPETALALSLAKRAREVILGVPGLLYLHFSERGWRRRLAV
jgi:putative membrane protein